MIQKYGTEAETGRRPTSELLKFTKICFPLVVVVVVIVVGWDFFFVDHT